MLQTFDSFNQALLWTIVAGLAYVVITQARSRRDKHDVMWAMVRDHLVTTPVLRALLLTGLVVGGLEFVLLPSAFASRGAPVASGSGVLAAYKVPEAGLSVVKIQGYVSERPSSGFGEWRIGGYQFTTDSQTSIHTLPDQPVIACLVQMNGQAWKASAIASAAQPPVC